ncbi:hypothetical protein E2320_022721 [Naja naja]|nr:hypothetical protein E2320_022721 [Naja naja]
MVSGVKGKPFNVAIVDNVCLKGGHSEITLDVLFIPEGDVFHCTEVEEIDGMTHVLFLPKGWFMFCGAYAYAFIPANVIGGPCTIGRLTTVMATAHAKNINKETKLYYEVMNSSLYHDPRFFREPVLDDTVERDGHVHSHVHEHEAESKHAYPTVHWLKYRGKRSVLSDAYSEDCNDEVEVLSKVEAGFLGIFTWGATYYNNLQLGHLACALAKSINVTSSAIAALADEMGEIRKSVLQNRVAIDYVLLRMGHGCKEFDGMCCFDISDKAHFIESKLKVLYNITMHLTHITDSNAFKKIWDGLTSWLPDLTWLKEVFFGVVIIIVIGLISCICIQCMPVCKLFFRCCKVTKPKKQEAASKRLGQQEVRLTLREIDGNSQV